MKNLSDFDAKWLEKQISSSPEGAFLDFKIQPPILDEGNDDKFNFAKLLIAFGNMARSTGRECTIIFGVEDKSRRTKDLRDFYHPADRKKWDENTSIQTKQADGIEEKIRRIAENWITPVIPSFLLKFGEIQDGTFLSYLVISPTFPSVPFSLSKSHGSFSPGTVFVRACSASVPILPTEVKYLLAVSKSEYLSRSEWQMVFNYHKLGEFEAAYNILPTFRHKTKAGRDALSVVVEAINENKPLILIKGAAGEGKSTLLRRIAYWLSYSVNLVDEIPRNDFGDDDVGKKVDENTYILESFINEMSNVPRRRVPVYMSLRTTFDRKEDLSNLLLNHISREILGKNLRSLDGLFAIPGVLWVILLDGVDEIRNLKTAGPILSEWIQLLPTNVQIVVTSRPHASPKISSDLFELAALSRDDVFYLIRGKIQSSLLFANDLMIEEVTPLIEEIINFIQLRPELVEFLSRHRAIDGILAYLGIPRFAQYPLDDVPGILVRPTEINAPQSSGGVLPVIGLQNELEQDETQVATLDDIPKRETEDVSVRQYRLVEMLYAVYEHLRSVEIIRQGEFGFDTQKEADRAAFQLAQAAWYSKWFEPELNAREVIRYIDEPALDWNQFAGFIQYQRIPRYRYCCSLFQFFIIAQYAYENEQTAEILARVKKNEDKYVEVVPKVLSLYNDFCKWHGDKEPISVPPKM